MKKKGISVKPEVFRAMQNVDIDALESVKACDIRPVLPCLARTALCAPVDKSDPWSLDRKNILKILSGLEDVNSIVALLSIDFNALEQDVKKEQALRAKVGSAYSDSVLISQLQNGLALEFEHSDPARRIRLLLSEVLYILSQVRENKTDFSQKQWELFDCEVYLEEVADVLCIAYCELPGLLPISDLAEALMYVPNGPWLLCRLVANSPDSFRQVCESLVSKGEKQDEESLSGRKRMELLQSLCEINPPEALFVRSLCIHHCTMPGLAVALTLNSLGQSSASSETSSANGLVSFIIGLLLGNNIEVKNWFSHFIKCGQRRGREPAMSMLHAMRLQLTKQLIGILPEPGTSLEASHVIQAGSFIRLYCALKGIATLKFSDEEMKLLLRLVTSRPPISQSGVRLVSLGLCMLIVCPYIIGSQEQERQVADWIRWLIESETLFGRSSGKQSSFGEMLFLIAIHFHGNHMHAISELVCSTLGMKCPVKANALARIRQIFTQEIFTEQVITSHAVTVPVTQGLNATMDGYLPLHCIYQLLKSRAFSKYKVPIKDWIYKQISVSSYPLHPLLVSLIEVYVNSILVKSNKTDHNNQPISSQEIADMFTQHSVFSQPSEKGRDVNLTPQLCMLYYVLLYEDTLEAQGKAILLSGRHVESYPDALMSQIPINYLIQQSQKRQDLYGDLFSHLLKLLVTQFPHLCMVEDWLDDVMTVTSKRLAPTHKTLAKKCSVDGFKQALDTLDTNCCAMLVMLEQILALPVEELWPFTDLVVSCLPRILSPDVPRKVVDLVKKVWFKIHSLMPRSIRLSTVNALRPQKKRGFKFSQYTETDVTVDPLIVLRCDERVFRCGPVLEIVLRILGAYTLACRVYLENHIQCNPVADVTCQVDQNRQELKGALLAAQESAILQILLEYCLPSNQEKQVAGMLTSLQEVKSIICSYIHQAFISDPNLAKLVHFQGYPSELLPVTVRGIPSMHICLDYIPEMLSQPQMDKQIFAIKLTSQLCCQYALPKSLSVAKLCINVMFAMITGKLCINVMFAMITGKLCINVMFAMITVLETKQRVEFFCDTLPSLAQVCRAFPPLCEDVTSLLLQIGRVCVSHITGRSNVPQHEFSLDSLTDQGHPSPPRKRLKSDGNQATYHELYSVIQHTFASIVKKSVVMRNVY
ncbi:integrator complex subunit 2-like isoform X3 [Dreissena polymorpha]|uniref:integrator complex subunit 2-like isoform X3 n=1 Tax=Dreissena polymorpha TaxID=45954 RepID=UPI00226494AE|nr:integrator complex subunit 2-like isoform X3 [Dreissena polymorpha]